MPEAGETLHHLNDFTSFLEALEDGEVRYVVIGGCAVGLYASLRGESVLTRDLDVMIRPEAMADFIAWASTTPEVQLVKRPRPRTLQVAVLHWRGLEVNVLTGTARLDPDLTLARARQVVLSGVGLEVAIADPFDLLANKLAVDRPKDRPHAEVLKRFLDEEVVLAFAERGRARQRLEPAKRLLEVLGLSRLPEPLFGRLVSHADRPALRRFLVQRAPSVAAGAPVVEAAADETERSELARILRAAR